MRLPAAGNAYGIGMLILKIFVIWVTGSIVAQDIDRVTVRLHNTVKLCDLSLIKLKMIDCVIIQWMINVMSCISFIN